MSLRRSSKVTKKPSQGEKFIDTARALGCDESEERFDAALKKIAAAPPPPKEKAKPKKPGK